MKVEVLISDLIQVTNFCIEEVSKWKNLPIDKLNYKLNDESWSKLECIQHLNLYGDFYLPEINFRLLNSDKLICKEFKSSMLGNYFVNSIRPNSKTMKTFKSMNPNNSKLEKSVIDVFLVQQKEILRLLDFARDYNLNKIKTSISITKIIKLRLGDTFQVVVYHNLRHVQQGGRIV